MEQASSWSTREWRAGGRACGRHYFHWRCGAEYWNVLFRCTQTGKLHRLALLLLVLSIRRCIYRRDTGLLRVYKEEVGTRRTQTCSCREAVWIIIIERLDEREVSGAGDLERGGITGGSWRGHWRAAFLDSEDAVCHLLWYSRLR